MLEEEGDPLDIALVPKRSEPFHPHGTVTGTRLAASDEPVHPVELQAFKWSEEGFGGDESNGGGHQPQIVGPVHEATVLDRYSHPDIRMPGQRAREVREAFMPLCEDLKRMPLGAAHHVEDVLHKLVGDVLVEQVAHRVHEDHPRPLPTQRLVEPFRPEPKVESLLVGVTRDTAPSLGECFGVAVGAARRDLVAACDRVPGGLGPFDRTSVSHGPGQRICIPYEHMFVDLSDIPSAGSLERPKPRARTLRPRGRNGRLFHWPVLVRPGMQVRHEFQATRLRFVQGRRFRQTRVASHKCCK